MDEKLWLAFETWLKWYRVEVGLWEIPGSSPNGGEKNYKKKGWKIMINACELFVVRYFEVLHTLNCLVILYG